MCRAMWSVTRISTVTVNGSPSLSYGVIWVPVVAVGWAPYHNGYWNWIAPWGWTWIAGERWGFAPCHYGRWVHAPRYGWAWVPGPRSGPRPVYAPALVAWRGETNSEDQSGHHAPAKGRLGSLGLSTKCTTRRSRPAAVTFAPPIYPTRTWLTARSIGISMSGSMAGRAVPIGAMQTTHVSGAYSDAPREAFASAKSDRPAARDCRAQRYDEREIRAARGLARTDPSTVRGRVRWRIRWITPAPTARIGRTRSHRRAAHVGPAHAAGSAAATSAARRSSAPRKTHRVTRVNPLGRCSPS